MNPRSLPSRRTLEPRSRRAAALLLGGLVLVTGSAASAQYSQNPLAKKPAPAAEAPDPFVRRFQTEGASLRFVRAAEGYTGTLEIEDAQIPVRAHRTAALALEGTIEVGGEQYSFTATLEGDRLSVVSDGDETVFVGDPLPPPEKASGNPLAKKSVPPPLEGIYEGPVERLRHPEGYFTCDAPKGWAIAQAGEGAVLINPGLGPQDTLDCLLVVTYGELDEDERGVEVTKLFADGEAELLEGFAQQGITVQKAEQPPRKVAVGDRAGAEQIWKGETQGAKVKVWCGGVVEREYYLAVVAVLVEGKEQRFLPGVKRLFRSIDPKAPERNPALERSLAGATFSSGNGAGSGGSFYSIYTFAADGTVKKEMLASGMVGISIDVGANTEEYGRVRTAGEVVYLQFRSGQEVARAETDGKGNVTALLFGGARYARR